MYIDDLFETPGEDKIAGIKRKLRLLVDNDIKLVKLLLKNNNYELNYIELAKPEELVDMLFDVIKSNNNIMENLRQWFKEKWVRFGPDGKIRGDCARGDDSEGKPKCLPQAKAHALGKKGRKQAASRKRREDPNPERSGPAINVKTKESQQGLLEAPVQWHNTETGVKDAAQTDHTLDEALEYLKTNYPVVKMYNVRRAAMGLTALDQPKYVDTGNEADINKNIILKSAAHMSGVDSAVDYLQLRKNTMMSGSQQVTFTIGYSWSVYENPNSGIAMLYYQDRGMAWDEIYLAGKTPKIQAQARQVFRDAGVLPTPMKKPKQQGMAEDFTDDLDNIYAMHPQPEESEQEVFLITDMTEDEFSNRWTDLPDPYQEEFGYDLPLWDTDDLGSYQKIAVKPITFDQYVQLVGNYIKSEELAGSAMSKMKRGVAEGVENSYPEDFYNIIEQIMSRYTGKGGSDVSSIASSIIGFANRNPQYVEDKQQEIRTIKDYLGYNILVDPKDPGSVERARRTKEQARSPEGVKKVEGAIASILGFTKDVMIQVRSNPRYFGEIYKVWGDGNFTVAQGNPDAQPDTKQGIPSTVGDMFFAHYTNLKHLRPQGIKRFDDTDNTVGTISMKQGVAESELNELAPYDSDDREDPIDNYPCYDCGSTIFLHHTKLCDLAEDNAIRDLPAEPGSQHWTGEIPKGLTPIPGLQEGSLNEFAPNDSDNDENRIPPNRRVTELAKEWAQSQKDWDAMQWIENTLEHYGYKIRLHRSSNTGDVYVVVRHKDKKWDDTSDLSDLHFWTIDELKKDLTEEQITELKCWPGYTRVRGVPAGAPGSCKKKTNEEIQQENKEQVRRIQQHLNKEFNANLDVDGIMGPLTKKSIAKFLPPSKKKLAPNPEKTTAVQGAKLKEGKCPECGGPMFEFSQLSEKKDACYYKVKSRYKVWPSAYASGALVKCRKKGAKNWGNKSESVQENKIYFSIPKSLENEQELTESFKFNKDSKGWYLKETQENFKQNYRNALKAFTILK